MTSRTEDRPRWLAFRASCLACAAAGVAVPAMADGRSRPGGFKPDKVSPLGTKAPDTVAAGSGAPPDPFPELAGGPGATIVTTLPHTGAEPADAIRSPTVHILQPVINGIAQSETVMIPILNGKILLPEDFLNSHGMLFAPDTIEFGAQRFVPSTSLEGAVVGVELARGRLVIDCGVSCYRQDMIAARDNVRGEMSPVALGGFTNYELFAQQGGDSDSAGALVQAGVFSQMGTGQAFVSCSSLREDQACLRLETKWTIDDPDSVRRLRIGDSVTKAETWGRPARYGGVSWGTDFALDPGFISFPIPTLPGESVLPGIVDILINDQKRFTGEVEPGPFSITDAPLITGAGTATVIVTDMLGRETTVETAYYAAPQLLKRDLSSYSVEAGFLRQNYGLASNDYGDGFVAGGYAQGVTDTLTLGARSELSSDRQTVGVSATLLNPALGVSEGAVAISSDDDESGVLASLRHEYRSHKVTLGANVEYASRAYRGLGEVEPRPQVTSRAFVGLTFEKMGQANLNWTYRDEWSGQSFSSIGLGWSRTVGRAVFHLTAFREMEPTRALAGAVRMTIPLGRGVASAGADTHDRRVDGRASYRVSPKADGETGYNAGVSSGIGDRLEAGAMHRSRVADVMVDYSSVDGETAVRETLRGGFAAVGGRVHASRAVNNSMAVVQVGEEEGVRVYVDRQLSGRTDEEGKVLLTNLRAYEDNNITFNPRDLNLGESISIEAIRLRPGSRTGHVASFDIRRGVNMMLAVRTEDGRLLPEGAVLRDLRLGTKYPVGSEGQIYIANAHNVSRLTYTMRKRTCAVDIVAPATTGNLPVVDGGDAFCRSFSEMARR